MCYFTEFNSVLKNQFKGNFAAMENSVPRVDRYAGRKARIVEIDRRQNKQSGYITTPDVQLSDIPKETTKDDFKFAVIDLEAELEKRRKSTEDNNPVQSESDPAVSPDTSSITLKPRTTMSSRGAVIQTQTGEGIITETTITGNRKQRKAYEAIMRKKAKRANKGTGRDGETNKGATQEKGSPTGVNLRDLPFGFRLE